MGELEIYTLGNFSVEKDDEVITDGKIRLSKRWKLFQYLFTFRRREVPREELINVLDLDGNCDARGSLTALVYRMRRLLEKYSGESDGSDDSYILTRGKAYTFNQEADYWLDAEEFAELCDRTRQYISEDSEKACRAFERALELYEGEYLAELNSEEWIWNARNRYRDMLVATLHELADYMGEKGHYEKLWQFYERAQEVVQFEEKLIKGSIEALLGSGNISLARLKYEEAETLYQENDLILPASIKKLEPRLKRENNADPSTYLESIRDRSEVEGAYVCGPEIFTLLYDLEKRRSRREVISRFVVHLRLAGKSRKGENYSSCEKSELAQLGDKLLKILQKDLRCGDIVCRWSGKHFIILLINLSENDVSKILERIKKSWKADNNLPEEMELKSRSYRL